MGKLSQIQSVEKTIRPLEEKELVLIKKRDKLIQDNKIITGRISKKEYNTNSAKIIKVEKQIKKLKQKIDKLLFKHQNNIYNILITEDDKFNEICECNYQLINNSAIEFVSKNYQFRIRSMFTKEFKGELTEDGIIKCKASKINKFNIDGFSPLNYDGSLNALGHISINATGRKTGFFQRVPVNYKGMISDNGKTQITVTRADIDIIGSQYVKNLIGDISFSNDIEKEEFFYNKKTILSIINDYRKSIIT